jgi:hypothetical protein
MQKVYVIWVSDDGVEWEVLMATHDYEQFYGVYCEAKHEHACVTYEAVNCRSPMNKA